MPKKAYWIARVDITNQDDYKKYADLATEAFVEFRANVLARGGDTISLEGKSRARNVVIEFASLADAISCYESEIYQRARKYRVDAAEGEILIVSGA